MFYFLVANIIDFIAYSRGGAPVPPAHRWAHPSICLNSDNPDNTRTESSWKAISDVILFVFPKTFRSV